MATIARPVLGAARRPSSVERERFDTNVRRADFLDRPSSDRGQHKA
jgi:hypothetical protein